MLKKIKDKNYKPGKEFEEIYKNVTASELKKKNKELFIFQKNILMK